MTQLFKLDSVSVSFGPIAALTDCSLRIQAGDRLALVGANDTLTESSLKSCVMAVPHESPCRKAAARLHRAGGHPAVRASAAAAQSPC